MRRDFVVKKYKKTTEQNEGYESGHGSRG